jgi:hypothetical protein
MEERLTEPELHYEFVLGLSGEHHLGWCWMRYISDDAGTEDGDSNGGAFDGHGEDPRRQ